MVPHRAAAEPRRALAGGGRHVGTSETLTDGAITLTLIFRFAADGTIASVRAESRGRTAQGKVIPTPWEGVWSHVAERDGMRVPLTGEVAWLTSEGRKPYWRGTITAVAYECTPP